MKYVAILLGAVILLVAAWLLVGGPWKTSVGNDVPSGGAIGAPRLEPVPPGNREALRQGLHALFHAASHRERGGESIAYITALADRLEEPLWNEAAPQVLLAWEKLRGFPEWDEALRAMEGKVTRRFVATGTEETLGALVKLASQASGVGERTRAALAEKAHEPVRSFRNSRAFMIIAAAARAGELDQAREYSEGVAWGARATESDKAAHAALGRAIGLALVARTGTPEIHLVVAEWNEGRKGVFGDAAEVRDVALGLLLEVGAGFVRSEIPGTGEGRLKPLVGRSREGGDARAYWDAVARALSTSIRESLSRKGDLLGTLFAAYTPALGRSAVESELWLALAKEKPPSKAREPLFVRAQSLEYLRRALGAATGDEERILLIREVKSAYISLGRYDEAKKMLPEEIARVEDPAKRSELGSLLAEIEADQISERRRVKDVERSVEKANLRGQLDHMKDSLARARKAGRSEEDLRSLESVVHDLESKVAGAEK